MGQCDDWGIAILPWFFTMTRTATLRRQHDVILHRAETIETLSAMLDEPRDVRALLRELRRMDGALIAHLGAEDNVLYPEMARSIDPMTASTAIRFMREMGDLAQTYQAFTTKWMNERRIAADPNGFRASLNTILVALKERISRENEELYPLADAMHERALSSGTRVQA